jgi:hypothetical protein
MWAAVLAFFAKELTIEGLKTWALRAIIASAIAVLLPIALYNVYCMILSEVLQWAVSQISTYTVDDGILDVVGMGAWLVGTLKIDQALALYISALIGRMSIQFVMKRVGLL